ncbi:hypothetical protein PIB30_043239 [Stylosanthes scabra]|uniref:Auxilin-related protein 2 n=1 Tax=Stylosanthes scabra TaxID=79078 RepID=A0ABU6SGS2_9FABA|nr:hypothetical protein [Stylosanthes scabra]
MNDFDGLLASEFGYKPQGKSAPMAPSKGSSNSSNTSSSLNFDLGSRSARATNSMASDFGSNSVFGSSGSMKNRDAGGDFDDLFSGSTARSQSRGGADSPFDLDSMFRGGSSSTVGDLGSRPANSPKPVYDKPVYDDDDIFDGIPGLKSTPKAKYEDIFASAASSAAGGGSSSAFDDLLGGFGRESKTSGAKRSEKDDKGDPAFDDLLAGFGSSKPASNRHTEDIGLSTVPPVSASKATSTASEDPFRVFESVSAPVDSTSGHFTDPLEEISKFSSSRSTKNDSSSNSNGRVYDDDIDPFGGLGQSVPAFSSERNSRKGSLSPQSNTSPSSTRDKEQVKEFSARSPEKRAQNKIPVENDREVPQSPPYMPSYSPGSNIRAGQRSTSPHYNNTDFRQVNAQEDMSPKYEENVDFGEDIWLTVSEVPLFTQPTTAPPPSRPPPPRPVNISRMGTGSAASANSRKKANEYSTFPSSTRFSQVPKSATSAARASPTPTQFDELDDFAMGRNRANDEESGNGLLDEELGMNSAAAAMKEAMDRAEAKFKHAREVRERENTRAARNREGTQFEKDEMLEEREKQERSDRERQQKEREENEQRRLMKEREEKEREQQRIERERARQAVERATREARERAVAEARQKAERAAAGKAAAEARERAERAAVQRAQAEARERAAAEAKERAERVAAEAKERAEAEARAKAERAAVERAAAEARERAAAEARERAAAAAGANQKKNEDDLESFFGMGARASSAPRPPRTTSSDSLFENQFQSDVTRRSTGASSNMKKASSSTNIADDLSSIFGAAPSSGEFQEVEGETEERRRARLERHQRTQERAAKALAEKNQRDLQTQREQAERHRLAETLDFEIKRWAAGKEGNLRALLSTLQYVLWPECGWQPVSLTDLITGAAVKKSYRKATLCIHPDKVQQKGATLQQKYIAEKVFDLLKEAWNKFNSEELF